jgi:hypothetical protein
MNTFSTGDNVTVAEGSGILVFVGKDVFIGIAVLVARAFTGPQAVERQDRKKKKETILEIRCTISSHKESGLQWLQP